MVLRFEWGRGHGHRSERAAAARLGLLLAAAVLAVAGTGSAATRATTLPTWHNDYDWASGGGYVGWHAQASTDGDYGMQADLGGNAGLWLWPLGGHGAYQTADGAEWTYAAPATTRISSVDVSYAWSNKLFAHHCLDVGLRDAGGGIVAQRELCSPPPQSPVALTLTDPAGNPTAKVLYFRIRVDCGGEPACAKTIPSLDPLKNGAYARLDRADLTLVDDDAPTLAPSGPLFDLRGTYIDGTQTYGLTVAASDAGSGIARAWLERQGYADPTGTLSSADAPCDSSHRTPALDARICPAAFDYATSVDTSTLAEGTSHFSEHAVDVAGNTGASDEWLVYVDRTGPSAPSGITLSGFNAGDGSGAVNFERSSTDPSLPEGPPGSGVAGYEARYDAGGGWTDWAQVPENSFDVAGLVPGGTLSERGAFVRYWSNLRAGDVVQVDWQGKFDHDGPKIAPTHSMLVTGLIHGPGGSLKDVLLTYHTTNRLNYSLAGLMRKYPHAVWWGIHLSNSF